MNINELTILICDDSILARKQIKDILSTLGTPTFVEATDGQKAIEEYKRVNPDLVFLDIVMPKKDGNDAIQEIMQYDPDATIESGAKDFIQKPLDKNQLLTIVNNFLEGR